MKIGHVSLSRHYGGSEHQLLMLAKSLSHHGIGQHALVRNPVLARRLARFSNTSVGPIVNSQLTACGFMPDVDLVHLHDRASLYTGLLLSLSRSIPYLVTHRSMNPPPRHALSKALYKRAQGIVCVSQAACKTMLDFCPDTLVDSVYDACRSDRTCLLPARPSCVRGDDAFVVGHVGELNDAAKGQGIILDIAEELVDDYPQIRFVLAGRGKDEQRFRERASCLQNVSFTGWLPNLQVFYETMDVFLFPSRQEALGSAMLEAMSYRLPVIASNVGGIPEVVRHRREGILVAAGDGRGFRDALLALFGDLRLRKRLGDDAYRRARLFSPERMAAQYARIYRRTLDSQGVPALLI